MKPPLLSLRQLLRRLSTNRECLKWISRFSVALTLAVILACELSLLYSVFVPFSMLEMDSFVKILVVLYTQVLLALILISWILAVTADPGFIPLSLVTASIIASLPPSLLLLELEVNAPPPPNIPVCVWVVKEYSVISLTAATLNSVSLPSLTLPSPPRTQHKDS